MIWAAAAAVVVTASVVDNRSFVAFWYTISAWMSGIFGLLVYCGIKSTCKASTAFIYSITNFRVDNSLSFRRYVRVHQCSIEKLSEAYLSGCNCSYGKPAFLKRRFTCLFMISCESGLALLVVFENAANLSRMIYDSSAIFSCCIFSWVQNTRLMRPCIQVLISHTCIYNF